MASRSPVAVSSALDPADMALRGRLGAYVLHSRYDPRETTKKARQAFLARFLREVDPDGVLPEAERQRRALAARRAFFVRLALKSARARRAGRRRRGSLRASSSRAVPTTEAIEAAPRGPASGRPLQRTRPGGAPGGAPGDADAGDRAPA